MSQTLSHRLLPLTLLLAVQPVQAQLPIDSLVLTPGFGVDTTSEPTRQIFTLWRTYLTTSTDSARARSWRLDERARWAPYDLIAPAVYNGRSRLTVLEISPAVGMASTYRIRTLIAVTPDSTEPTVPLLIYQVFATSESDRWTLANALPRLTQAWDSTTIGHITFVRPPGYPFHRDRAGASARFVDSLSHAYGLGSQQPITYYYTEDLRRTLTALGLEYYPLAPDTLGGRSNAITRQVFVGLPSHGESYRHELAHVVLQPVLPQRFSRILMEGLMTWVGGRDVRSFGDLMPALDRYLTEHQGVTLLSLLQTPPPRAAATDAGYDGLAALFWMVHQQGGVSSVRSLLEAGNTPQQVLDRAASLLGISTSELGSRWRKQITSLAQRHRAG